MELMAKAETNWAYQKCTILGATTSTMHARCDICGFERKMNAHKMGHGHYLRQPGNDVKTFCVATEILQRDHSEFYSELTKRHDELMTKRKRQADSLNASNKR